MNLLKFSGEGSVVPLFVPLLQPEGRAEILVVSLEPVASLELLTLGIHTSEVIDVVLPAVPGLVLVGEPGVEGRGQRGLFLRESGNGLIVAFRLDFGNAHLGSEDLRGSLLFLLISLHFEGWEVEKLF